MIWNNNNRDVFQNNSQFYHEYCRPRYTLAGVDVEETNLELNNRISERRRIAKWCSLKLPNLVHRSPGYDYARRPWLVVGRFTGPAGVLDGKKRISIFTMNGVNYIGFRFLRDFRDAQPESVTVSNTFLNRHIDIDDQMEMDVLNALDALPKQVIGNSLCFEMPGYDDERSDWVDSDRAVCKVLFILDREIEVGSRFYREFSRAENVELSTVAYPAVVDR